MKVMDVAAALGLTSTNGVVTGTINEKHVLDALSGLAAFDPENSDWYDAAADRVRQSRSAGVEDGSKGGASTRATRVVTTQLRYRSEMADIFTDVAIDIGLRHNSKLVLAA